MKKLKPPKELVIEDLWAKCGKADLSFYNGILLVSGEWMNYGNKCYLTAPVAKKLIKALEDWMKYEKKNAGK